MKRVLIVDDREENRYLLRALLEGNDFRVQEAHDGREALALARETAPDLIVSDLLMPVMDGYSLLREWKADPGLREVPFIVYTATYTQPEDRGLALDLGADAIIVKPAEPDALIVRITEILERTGDWQIRRPVLDDDRLRETHSEVLMRKLEEKMLELEAANRALQVDLLERTRAKEELEAGATLLRIAGQAARLGGWSWRNGSNELSWSDEICAIHELPVGHQPTLEEAFGFYAPGDREKVMDAFQACAREGVPFDHEFRISTARGNQRWVRTIGEAVRGEKGHVVSLQGAFQDISERRALERQFVRAQRMESIATLTGGMAHDLNNVLTPILLATRFLMEDIHDTEARESLEIVESCAQRGADMVQQVLSFARGVEGTPSPVDLARMLGDLARVVRDVFPRAIRLAIEVPDDLWRLVVDPTQLHQVILNLLVNARDAMPDGGTVTILAENVEVDSHYAAMSREAVPGPHVRISVVDTGSGIPPEVLPRIFEPFFTTKDERHGTGLGLSTVATILRNHGGFVNVYSEPGRGSTFRMHFPAAQDEGHPVTAKETRESWQGTGELILVVDDEAAVRSLTQQTLEAYGYRVVTAVDGADAVEAFRNADGEVALVLTDVTMPVMDGPAMITELVRLDPRIPIVAASGIGADGGMTRARDAGADHFLPKPYSADALLSGIRRALSEPRRVRPR